MVKRIANLLLNISMTTWYRNQTNSWYQRAPSSVNTENLFTFAERKQVMSITATLHTLGCSVVTVNSRLAGVMSDNRCYSSAVTQIQTELTIYAFTLMSNTHVMLPWVIKSSSQSVPQYKYPLHSYGYRFLFIFIFIIIPCIV